MTLTSSTHNHTTLCDGKNTPEEMAEAALAAGFTDFGFSGHSHALFDPGFCIRSEKEYVRTLRALQKDYEGKLRVAVGLEQDYYAPVENRAALDYIIASVHCFRSDAGRYYAIDGSARELEMCVNEMFGGDGLAMARAYYALVADHARQAHPEIIGHFDLVKKNNRDGRFFDEDCAEYRDAALAALEACAGTGAVFELNTGGVFRGYREEPYPTGFLLEALREMGARVTVNADAHCAAAICFHFEESLALLRKIGFRTVTVLENGRFVEKSLGTSE